MALPLMAFQAGEDVDMKTVGQYTIQQKMSWGWRLFLIVVLTGGIVDLRQLTLKWNILQQPPVSYLEIGFKR